MPAADALSISFPFIVVILLVSHLPSSFSFEPTAVTSRSSAGSAPDRQGDPFAHFSDRIGERPCF
jgi:hypothetical protein